LISWMEKPFDRIAPYYNRWIGRFMSARMDRMAEMIACSPEETLLDLGGGTGLFARRLVGRCGEIHLLDESQRMIEQADCEKIRVRSGDATNTGYPERSFDWVVLSDVIHHIREQDRLFTEVARLLKPGGDCWSTRSTGKKPWGGSLESLRGLSFPRSITLVLWNFPKHLPATGSPCGKRFRTPGVSLHYGRNPGANLWRCGVASTIPPGCPWA